MKKTIATAVLLTASSAALANYGAFGGAGYSYYDGFGKNSNTDANAYTVQLGTKINNNLSVDGLTEFKDFTDSNAIGNRLEFGITPHMPVYDNFGVYGRLAIGQNWFSDIATTDFTYGSVEPGAFYNFGQGTVNLGYRFRDSFDNIPYETNSLVMGGEYKFDAINSVTGGYQYMSGDEEFNVFSIGYRANF